MRRIGLAAVCALLMLTSMHAQPTHATTRLRWIINGPALKTFTTDPAAVRFFADAKPFVIQGRETPTIPASWKAVRVKVFPSYASMKRAFDNNAIGSDVGAILYDNEHWNFTPAEEQQGFADYNKRAADLVHSHGLLFISTPAVNLINVLAAVRPGARKYDAFLERSVIADAARYSDVVDIQAQGSEMNVQKYANFVNGAAAQARAANPKVLVLAGISTNPNGQHVSADTILAAIRATKSNVDGYWFNVPKPSAYCPNCNDFRPDMALDVINQLGAF